MPVEIRGNPHTAAQAIPGPIDIAQPTSGGVQLAATHSRSCANWLSTVPGLKVVAPSTPYDALGLLRSALANENMVIVVEHVLLYGRRGEIPDASYTVPIRKADGVRSGDDLTIVSYHHGMVTALEAAERLSARGLRPR